MLKYVSDPKLRINWSDFVIKDDFAVKFRIDVYQSIVSENMLTLMLGETYYSMFNNNGHIGYGVGDLKKEFGYTEQEAFSEWIKQVKKKERVFRDTIPLISMSQSQYDALFSLYYHTGTWRTVQGIEGLYDLEYAVTSENWLLVSDMINAGIIEPDTRRKEARVLQLADYSTERTRAFQRNKGIQLARRVYKAGDISDQAIVRQIEFGYYRQTTAFLPRMTELRKRELLLKVGQL